MADIHDARPQVDLHRDAERVESSAEVGDRTGNDDLAPLRTLK
jgi:hypothetical protein